MPKSYGWENPSVNPYGSGAAPGAQLPTGKPFDETVDRQSGEGRGCSCSEGVLFLVELYLLRKVLLMGKRLGTCL